MSKFADVEYSAQKLKDIHKGETCLVIANGPGLRDVPIAFLKKYPSFGCNRITALYPEFVPTYYSCIGMNQLNTEEKRATIFDAIMDDRCKAAFINRMMIHYFRHPKVYSIMGFSLYNRTMGAMDRMAFSYDPLDKVGLGATQTHIAFQIAYYMGFTTALVVGLDHQYAPPEDPQKHFYKDTDFPMFEVAPGPGYPTASAWQQAANIVLEIDRKAYEADKREIVNLSEPTACKVLKRGRIEDW